MTLFSSVALLVACIDNGQTSVSRVDLFDVPELPQTDVLIVVDNSTSMDSYQALLGSNFNAFIEVFVEGKVDYHIAITTMDDGNDPAVSDPARGAFIAPIITADMELTEAEAVFREGVTAGSSGSGVEVGLKAAWLALTDTENLGEQISAFLRDDAGLSLVFLSDEEDQSPWPVNDYLNAYWELKGYRSRPSFTASALTVNDPAGCAAGTTEFSTPGTRYLDLADQSGGVSGDLCADDFDGIVHDLAVANTRFLDTYYLSTEPLAATLTVSINVDGVETSSPCESLEWSYELAGADSEPAIVFDRDFLPAPGSEITVRYDLGDGSADGFCGDSA